MAKQILIDSSFGMVRTAISDNGDLVDYYEESPDQGRNKGNIYRGVVKRVDAPIQAAFVKFAGGRDGFLPLRDASAGKPPQPGDKVLVQVVKDEVGDKGAALTAKLSLSGRYLVYIPEREGEGGISSKVSDEDRAALKKAFTELSVPEGSSVILRTAASDKTPAALQADLDKLIAVHRGIAEEFESGSEPALLFKEAPPALRYLREYYTDDVARVWVNSHESYEECRQFFEQYDPDSIHKVELSHDGALLFHRMGLEAEVEKLAARRVGLKSGANIVIDQAEALVAIDVNSAKASGRGEDGKAAEGKGKGKRGRDRRGGDLEETVFAVNKEAAAEIGRQLRLRDLGGIIIVDFIDMESEKHRRQVEEAMRKALAADKAKIKVYDISPLGIMQISRQRLRKSGHQFSRLHCESCQGRGWHPSASAGALGALRKLEERLHGKKGGQGISVSVPYPVANKMMNEFREHLLALEKRHACAVRVIALGVASGDPVFAALGGGEGQPRNGDAPREAQGREAVREREGQGRDGHARDGGRRDGQARDGQARDGQARDGRGRDGKGRDGRGRDGQDRNGPPRENRGRDGRNRDQAREPLAVEARALEGAPAVAVGPEGQAPESGAREGRDQQGRNADRQHGGRGRDGRPRDGRGRDGQGRDGRNRDGRPETAPVAPELQAQAAGDSPQAADAQPGQAARVPNGGDGRERGREERGGRRRRGGRGRGRGRDRDFREGGPDRQGGQRAQGGEIRGEGGAGGDMPQTHQLEPVVERVAAPREYRTPDMAPAGEYTWGAHAVDSSRLDAEAPPAREQARPEAQPPETKADAAPAAARGGRGRRAPAEPVVKAQAKPAAPAARTRKGPLPVRPGSPRPAAQPKPRAAKPDGAARPQGTRAQAAPAAEAAAKPAKAVKPKRAAKTGTGGAGRGKSKG